MDGSRTLTHEDKENFLVERGPLERNPTAIYLASLAPSSRRTIRESLDRIARLLSGGAADAFTFNWASLRYPHAIAIRAKLEELYSAATANKMLSGLRGVLKAAYDLQMMSSEDYIRATSYKGVRGETLASGRALEASEFVALIEACTRDASAAGARDAAMIAIMRGAGLRRAELCGLEVRDYDVRERALIVRGKSNKMRMVPISESVIKALEGWLNVRGRSRGALFCPVRRNGVVSLGRGLTPQAIYKCLGKRAKEAGVTDISPHDLRRTFVSDLLDAGADLSVVQRLAGHSNVETTVRYDRRGVAAERRAVTLLDLPFTETGQSKG